MYFIVKKTFQKNKTNNNNNNNNTNNNNNGNKKNVCINIYIHTQGIASVVLFPMHRTAPRPDPARL